MKTKKLWFGRLGRAGLIAGMLAGAGFAGQTRAEVNLSVNVSIQSPADFNAPLAPYGSWLIVSSYGRCWRPASILSGWRPYTLGHWEWTDAGWYWVSDEPWGWACFHYGQWVLDPAYGWVWLPGTEWSPAWVVWRQTPDYVGWAPCGSGGVAVSDASFAFVDIHHFHDRLQPQELVFNDSGIFRRSRPVGGFRTETRDWGGTSRRIAINQGPGVEAIQRATGKRITQRPVRELVQQNPATVSGRRAPNERVPQQSYITRQPPQQPNGRDQQRLYQNAPQTQPPSTGRQEPRIYREAPAPQPASSGREQQRSYPETSTRTTPAPTIRPQSQPMPEVKAPPKSVTHERVQRPAGPERGRPEAEVPRRTKQPLRPAEPSPKVTPAPQQQPAAQPNPAPKREGREKEHDGE